MSAQAQTRATISIQPRSSIDTQNISVSVGRKGDATCGRFNSTLGPGLLVPQNLHKSVARPLPA